MLSHRFFYAGYKSTAYIFHSQANVRSQRIFVPSFHAWGIHCKILFEHAIVNGAVTERHWEMKLTFKNN